MPLLAEEGLGAEDLLVGVYRDKIESLLVSTQNACLSEHERYLYIQGRANRALCRRRVSATENSIF